MSGKIHGASRNSERILYEMDLFGPQSALDLTVSPPVDRRKRVYKVVEVVDQCTSFGIYYCRDFVLSIPGGNTVVPKFLRSHSCSFNLLSKRGPVLSGNDPAFSTHTDFEKNCADDYAIQNYEIIGKTEDYEKAVKNSLSKTNLAEAGNSMDCLAELVLSYISLIWPRKSSDLLE